MTAHVAGAQDGAAAALEFSQIIGKLQDTHALFGFKFADFIGQSQTEFDEMVAYASGLADRRALARLYRQCKNM